MAEILESFCNEAVDFVINIVADKIVNKITARKREKGQKSE